MNTADTWTKVDQNGVVGYVLTRNVEDLGRGGGLQRRSGRASTWAWLRRELTIRAEKSKSALKLQDAGSRARRSMSTELGDPWFTVVKQGVRGYVAGLTVSGSCQPAHEGIELPEAYQPLPDFKAVYSATADVNLSIRKEKDENAKLLGTVYENESVDVMDFDEQVGARQKGQRGGLCAAQPSALFPPI